MKIDILDITGSKSRQIKLEKSVFGIDPNIEVVRQVVLAELSNMRQGTHSSKNRAMVNGGGKKPWKQKGRGAARAGTNRSPLWRGGGTIFGPEPHKYTKKITKKLSKLARRSVLSNIFSERRLVVLDSLEMGSHKTSAFVNFLTDINLNGKKVTVLVDKIDENIKMATSNLKDVFVVESKKVSSYDLIDCEFVIADENSIKNLIKILST